MPRKRTVFPDGYFNIFPTRLRQCMKERRCRQQDLADILDISRQAVSYYMDGKSIPTIITLGTIAYYFDVSADWLIGLSDIRQRDPKAEDLQRHIMVARELAENANTQFNRLFEAIIN